MTDLSEEAKRDLQIQTALGKIRFQFSPVGNLQSIFLDSFAEMLPADSSSQAAPMTSEQKAVFENLYRSLERYFDRGEPLECVPWSFLCTESWTEFQRSVYFRAASIPHGETRSYGWLAARVGKPGASRAVGQMLRRNPLPILIPCHRVVAQKGGVGGFMGKADESDRELKLKKTLIELETNYLHPPFPFLAQAWDLTGRFVELTQLSAVGVASTP